MLGKKILLPLLLIAIILGISSKSFSSKVINILKRKMPSKIIGALFVCVMIGLIFGGLIDIASAANFSIGDNVEVTANLNVRTGAGTSYPEITDPDYPGYAPKGTIGEILSGPSSADGYIWWEVDFGPGLYSGWSVEEGLKKIVSAEIDSYSPSTQIIVGPGESFTIKVWFTNTGSSGAYFYPGASIWDSNWNLVSDDWGSKTYLGPGQQASASWTPTISTPGEYYLQFGVWDETKSELLDKEPYPAQKLIVVESSVLAEINSYSPNDPNNPVKVVVGESTTISVTFTNTGNTSWSFIAGASVWDHQPSPGDMPIEDYEEPVYLQPGQQTTVSWSHPVNKAGDYWFQFGIWKYTPYTFENLLDKEPSSA